MPLVISGEGLTDPLLASSLTLVRWVRQLHESIWWHLDGGQHDGRVGVRQARRDALADGVRLARVARRVVGQRVQDEHLPPLRALVQRRQQLVDRRRVHLCRRHRTH